MPKTTVLQTPIRIPGPRAWLRRSWPWRTTATQQLTLLRVIAITAEEQLPLAPLLAAWSEDERGVQRRRVRRIAQLMDAGAPLPAAVEEVSGALRDADVLAIRFGVQSGTLRASLDEAINDYRPASPWGKGTFGYLVIVSLLFFVLSLFIYVKLIPSMNYILEEYGLEATRSLQWSIAFSVFVERYWWFFVLLISTLLYATFSARPGRMLRQSFVGRLFRPLWTLGTADILQKLSVAAAAGRPVAGSISTLARYHFDPAVRSKLLFVRNEIEQGANPWQSLATVGILIPADEALLASADRVGNRPWALEQLAAAKKRRTWRRLDRAAELILPVMVVLLGLFVLLQGLAIMTPLIYITMRLI
jgi:type II secretory pathway component PulF